MAARGPEFTNCEVGAKCLIRGNTTVSILYPSKSQGLGYEFGNVIQKSQLVRLDGTASEIQIAHENTKRGDGMLI